MTDYKLSEHNSILIPLQFYLPPWSTSSSLLIIIDRLFILASTLVTTTVQDGRLAILEKLSVKSMQIEAFIISLFFEFKYYMHKIT